MINALNRRHYWHRGCSVRKYVLRNFAKFTGKHLCFVKKRLWHRCFPVAKFLWTPSLQNTSARLFLNKSNNSHKMNNEERFNLAHSRQSLSATKASTVKYADSNKISVIIVKAINFLYVFLNWRGKSIFWKFFDNHLSKH